MASKRFHVKWTKFDPDLEKSRLSSCPTLLQWTISLFMKIYV